MVEKKKTKTEKKKPVEKVAKGEKPEKTEKAEAKEEKTKKPEKKEVKKEKTKKTEEAKPSKTYVIPLRKLFNETRTKRARNAAKVVRDYVIKHTKSMEVKIDSSVNERLYSKGKSSIPRKIKVTVTEEGEDTLVKLA